MKSRLMKALLSVTAVATVVAAMSVTAMAAVTATHNSDKTNVTASTTNESYERLVIAEFDIYGKMTNLKVGDVGATSATGNFTLDQEHTTKIMRFSDFENATALNEPRVLGSKTLFVWEGSDGIIDMASGSIDPYGSINSAKNAGVVTEGTGLTFKSNGTSYSPNWIHLPTQAASSDWTVFQFDLTVHGKNGADMLSDEIVFYLDNGKGHDAGYVEIGNINASLLSSNVSWTMNGSSIQSGNGTKTVAVVVNHVDRTYDVYSNGSKVGNTKTASGTYPIAALRIAFEKHYYNITLDNMYVYEGVAPRDVDSEILRVIAINEAKSLYNQSHPGRYEDNTILSQLNGKKAVHATTGVVYNGSQKVMLTNLPYVNASGVSMVPKDELASVLGITCGSTSGSETKNGVVYVPIESFLSGQTYDHGVGASDNDNLYVIGVSSFSPSSADTFNDAMLYYRPDMHEVLSLYQKSDAYGEHPRLIASQADFDRVRALCQRYLTNDFDKDGVKDFNGSPHYNANNIYMANHAPMFMIRRGMDNAYGRGTSTEANATPQFVPTNASQSPRMNYQRYFASDIHLFAFAYHMTGDKEYAEYAWADMEKILNFSELNLSHKLDVSEAMAGLAIGYDWLYDYWVETGRVEWIEERLYELALYVSWSGYTSLSGGMGSEFVFDNNHGVVANNGALMISLALMDKYPEECAWIASQAIKGMELNIDKWKTEMWYEGASYWELTMQHTVKFLDSLDRVLGTDFGISNLAGLSKAADAEMQFHAPRGIYNFGDANRDYFYVPELIWLDNRYGDGSISRYMGVDITYKYGVKDAQWQGEDYVLCALWYDAEKAWNSSVSMPLDYVNTDLDVITARDSWSWTDYSFFGAKGGNNPADGHSHLDTGSFVFEVNGVRWANELGMGTYDDDYFVTGDSGNTIGQITGARWKHMTVRAEAHNTIHDNQTTSTGDQKRAYADLNLVKKTDNGVIATVDMKPALTNASAATRGFFFTDNRQSLVIRDEINVNNTNKIWWNMMLPYGTTITDNGNGTYTLTYTTGEHEEGLVNGDGYRDPHTETLILAYDVQGGSIGDAYLEGSSWAPINSTNMLDVGVKNSGQIRFSVTPTNASTDVRITIKLTPGDATSTTALSAYTGGISTWSSLLN